MFKFRKNIFIWIFTVVCLASFAVLIIDASGNKPQSVDKSGEVVDTAGNIKERSYTVLILGKDRVSGLTDVMMLASLDSEKGRICVVQIPRDTYAEYSENHRKLNTATKVLEGEKELCRFLSDSLGVRIDGYISLELEGFRQAVDAIGGVELELDSTLYYNDPEQDLYIYLPKGKQHLDGKKAEMLVRYRSSYVRGDLDRLDVQKRFLSALFSKFKSSVNIFNAYDIASSLFPYVDTNIPLTAMVSLGIKALGVDEDDLVLMTLPGEDAKTSDGGSYYVMSAASAKKIFEEYFVIEGTGIDRKRLFEHPTNKIFREIYSREAD